MTVLHLLFSSRSTNFSASKVTMNGTPTGCLMLIAWPPSPMSYCADFMSLPAATAISYGNSVVVGMTFADWLFGAVKIAVNMIVSYLLWKASAAAKMKKEGISFEEAIRPKQFGLRQLPKKIVDKAFNVFPKDGQGWKSWAIKAGVSNAFGLAKTTIFGGEYGLSATFGGPYFSITRTINPGVQRTADGIGASPIKSTSTVNLLNASGTNTTAIDPTGNGPILSSTQSGTIRGPHESATGTSTVGVGNNPDGSLVQHTTTERYNTIDSARSAQLSRAADGTWTLSPSDGGSHVLPPGDPL